MEPSIAAKAPRRPAAARTSGRACTSAATEDGRAVGPKPSLVITYWPFTEASIAADVDALTDWAVTAMNPTSATPTITAEAVDAVRFGLRRAFSRASRPSTPNNRGRGAPSSGGQRRPDCRPQDDRRNRAPPSAPTPSTWRLPPSPPKRPMYTRTAPVSSRAEPATARRFEVAALSIPRSRMAATGAIVAARRAGRMAATRVMSVPTAIEEMTADAGTTRGVSGPAKPMLRSRALSPIARPIPQRTPTADATSPTTTASLRTEPTTWRRRAPSALRSASSRVRWATITVNVL